MNEQIQEMADSLYRMTEEAEQLGTEINNVRKQLVHAIIDTFGIDTAVDMDILKASLTQLQSQHIIR